MHRYVIQIDKDILKDETQITEKTSNEFNKENKIC